MSRRRVEPPKSSDGGGKEERKKPQPGDDTPMGKGDSSLVQTQQRSGPTKAEIKMGTVMAITLPLSLIIFFYLTVPLLSYCAVSLLGEDSLNKLWYFKQDMMILLTSECPVWITTEDRAYLEQQSDQQIRRVSNITQEQFVEIVNRGEPVIITDALRDWDAFGQFNCEYFMENYPEAEYFDWQGQKRVFLGNITHRPGFDGMTCASGYMEMFWESNAKYVKEWLSYMKLPYFYPEDNVMENAFNNKGFGSPPMTGFLGVPGTGVSPHLDETCDNFLTVQLSGVKNWSVSWPVKEGNKLRWSKPMVFTLHPGEAMMWYVSMQHHTEVIEDCSLSFSFMLKHPPPKDYYNKLVQDLLSVDRTERDKLYDKTHSAKLDFIDACGLYETHGNVYIT